MAAKKTSTPRNENPAPAASTTTTPPSTADIDTQIAAIISGLKGNLGQATGESIGYQTPYYGVPKDYKARGMSKPGIYYADRKTIAQESFYDLNNDPSDILYNNLNDQERLNLRNLLYSKGFYGKDKPASTRITEEDEKAMRQVLAESNWNQTRWEDYVETIKRRPDEAVGGTAPRLEYTNVDDLKVIANKVALETLGRRLDDDDAEAFARLYQQKQMRYQQVKSGPVSQVADPEVAVMQQIERKYGAESEAYGYVGAVNELVKMVGGY